jgi:hypothetical protein
MQHEFSIARRELDALEAEIAKEEPSPDVIRKIALRLWGISQKIIGYCASIADITIKAAAKSIGNTIGPAIAAAITAEAVAPGSLQSVVKMALDYASKLGG